MHDSTDNGFAHMNAGDLLVALRKCIDEAERLVALTKKENEKRERIELLLAGLADKQGLDRFVGSKGTVDISWKDEMAAKYDPEKWPEIVKWAVDSGHDFIVQRRLTDSRVVALVQEGVVLPDGLTVEAYPKVSVRRK